MHSSPIDKTAIRAKMLGARAGIDAAYARASAESVAKHLLAWIPPEAKIVAGYRAVRGELDIALALAHLSARGHTLCLPVTEAPQRPLSFRRWQLHEALEKGAYGIEVPLPGAPMVMPDVLIVPLLAFDKTGQRLGYGAGYYDCTIDYLQREVKNLRIIGAAYAMQQVEILPAEPHDRRLAAVVTEKNIITFPLSGGRKDGG